MIPFSFEPQGKVRSKPSCRQRVAVLAFHKVGAPPPTGWDTWFYIPDDIFFRQLQAIRSCGWSVVTLDEFLMGLTAPDTLPERAVLITFDDGCQSLRQGAVAALTTLRYPAVVFVPTDFIGGCNRFDTDTEPEEGICGWEDLRLLLSLGIAVQSHGVTHRAFSQLTMVEQAHELERSKCILETGLGTPVTTFAYPYGDGGTDAAAVGQLCRAMGYRAAFSYTGGLLAWPPADPYHLPRVPMGPDTDLHSLLREMD